MRRHYLENYLAQVLKSSFCLIFRVFAYVIRFLCLASLFHISFPDFSYKIWVYFLIILCYFLLIFVYDSHFLIVISSSLCIQINRGFFLPRNYKAFPNLLLLERKCPDWSRDWKKFLKYWSSLTKFMKYM